MSFRPLPTMPDKMAKMVIGRRCVDGKSDEILPIPLLLETLALEGTVVTLDAMGTRKIIAQAILGKKADCLFALAHPVRLLLCAADDAPAIARRRVVSPVISSRRGLRRQPSLW
jgi:hypothetical protein